MHVYFSGIGGVAIGPLARIARDAGYTVTGSNDVQSRYTDQFDDEPGIDVIIGQTRQAIAEVHAKTPIDWFVHTAHLNDGLAELEFAQAEGIKTSKRDEFISELMGQKNLQMLAVAGTHGKTNTTGLLVWIFEQLNIPVSYSIGSNISFGPNGRYQEGSQFFIYEADEFDKNFLHFKPQASIITAFDYDHPDTYPTQADYTAAFKQFVEQSKQVFTWQDIADKLAVKVESYDKSQAELANLTLPGLHTRQNAFLAQQLVTSLLPNTDHAQLLAVINAYPGTERRMEKLAENLYTDYAHHPTEIRAAIEAAQELNQDVVVVYQPHQNLRQQQLKDQYDDCFSGAMQVYWLPTYLSREPADSVILMPHEIIASIPNNQTITEVEMNDELWQTIQTHIVQNQLVLCLSAGDLDAWIRGRL